MTCHICWQPMNGGRYHGRCLKKLLGTTRVPEVDFGLADFVSLGLKLVGRASLAGVQQKVLVNVAGGRLEVTPTGTFILKPQSDDTAYPAVPENEAATLALARLVGIETATTGLFPLADGTWALLVRRFDRPGASQRLRFEDFCQLSRLPPKAKYEGSAERCAKVLRAFSASPPFDLVRLFRRWLFAWWVGDDDLHLKNLGLLENAPYGKLTLAPAYDMVSSRFYPNLDRGLAMPVGGKKTNLSLRDWREFAEYCELKAPLAEKIIAQVVAAERPALELIGRSLLPAQFKEVYMDLIRHRTDVLTGRVATARREHP